MESHDTDPDLATLLIDMLCSWRDEATLPNTPAYGLELLAIRQQELGGQALLEGRMSYEWEACQQAYLTFIRSRRTGKRWSTQIIKKLWEIAWDLWEHRNGILHYQAVNHAINIDTIHLDTRVQSIFRKLLGTAPLTDRHLVQGSLSDLLQKPWHYKRTWLLQAEGALKLIKENVRTAHERRIREIQLMRLGLRAWLSRTRQRSSSPLSDL
jgi:hypothetical protein